METSSNNSQDKTEDLENLIAEIQGKIGHLDNLLDVEMDFERLTNTRVKLLGLHDKLVGILNVHQSKLDNIDLSDKWLKEFYKIVDKCTNNANCNVDTIAAQLFISKRHLQRKVKELTGKTPKQYIDELRFFKVKKGFEIGRFRSLQEGSEFLGFRKASFFKKQFEKRFNILPSDIIKK